MVFGKFGIEEKRVKKTPFQLACEAIAMLDRKPNFVVEKTDYKPVFEFAISPGVANKRFTPEQFKLLAEVVGHEGRMDYSRDHQLRISIPTNHPEQIVEQLSNVGLLVMPVGDVITVKACDFCDGEKRIRYRTLKSCNRDLEEKLCRKN